MTGRFGKKPLRPKKGNRFYQAEASWVPRNKDHNFYSQVLVYRLQNKRQNPKKLERHMTFLYIFVFTKYVPPIQPRHSIHDINSTTNSTLPRSDYKGKVTVIHFYTSWGLPEETTKVFLIWRKTQTLGVFGWNGYDSTVFSPEKQFFLAQRQSVQHFVGKSSFI